ncbi:Manganese-dependent ADP-ribose/CDP-alcohol diphosphatase, partial [Cucurbita argyrosperma subsp. sororia]
MASASGIESVKGKQPLFSFGVISDVQYADIPDGRSFLGTPRYYRHSIHVLNRAVQNWNNHQKLKFVLSFGDIVDGFCPKDQSLSSVKKVVSEFDKFNGLVYHMIGNHCLYNLPRKELLPLLKISKLDGGLAYYDFSPTPNFRFVVLDGYDISVIGWPQDHPNSMEALQILSQRNPNADKNSPSGLIGLERRYLMFNGGVGKEQLKWLDGVLQEATHLKQKVIVCSHLPLDPGATSFEALLWNYDEVMNLIHNYNCVKVCLAGHDHKGGYTIDSHGIHHRVLEAALECPPGSDAFGHIDVYNDGLYLIATDRMSSSRMPFDSDRTCDSENGCITDPLTSTL